MTKKNRLRLTGSWIGLVLTSVSLAANARQPDPDPPAPAPPVVAPDPPAADVPPPPAAPATDPPPVTDPPPPAPPPAPPPVLAAAGAENVEEVTVTATHVERARDEAPAAISIVTRNDIRRRFVLTFDEALRREPGVLLLKFRTPVDNHGITVMRGLTGQNRTLMLLDGIPLNGVTSGEIPWANLPVDAIDRIEVARGPFSALYGGNAMAGVVNARTIEPQADTLMVRGGYGSFHSQTLGALYGTRLLEDKLSLLVGVERYATDGYEVQETRKTPGQTNAAPTDIPVTGWSASTDVTGRTRQYVIGSPGKTEFTRSSYFARASYAPSERTKLRWIGLYGEWAALTPSYRTALRDPAGRPVVSGNVNIEGKQIAVAERDFAPIDRSQQAAVTGVSVEHVLTPEVHLHGALSVTHQFSEETELRQVPTDINAAGRNWTTRRNVSTGVIGDAHTELQLASWNTLVAGISGNGAYGRQRIPLIVDRRERTVTGNLAQLGGRQLTGAAYANDEFRFGKVLRLYAGVRVDVWHNYDGFRDLPPDPGQPGGRVDFKAQTRTAINPKGSIVYLPWPGTTFRASVGTAFRPPTVTELYGGTAHAGTQTFGNPDLSPERILSFEAGAVQRLGKSTRFGVTAFRSEISNLIFARTTSPASAPVTVRVQDNAANARTQGLELEARQTLVADTLDVFGNYTLTDAKFTSFASNPAAEGKRLPQVPVHLYNAGVDARVWRLKGLLVLEGVSDAYAREDNTDVADGVPQGFDPYWVMDAKVGWAVFEHLQVSLAMTNLFDQKYYLSFGRLPGRTVFGEAVVTF